MMIVRTLFIAFTPCFAAAELTEITHVTGAQTKPNSVRAAFYFLQTDAEPPTDQYLSKRSRANAVR